MHIVRGFEFIEICGLIWPTDEIALLKIEGHAFDPLSDALEFVIVIIDIGSFGFDQFYGNRVTFWVPNNGLARLVGIFDVELNYETSLYATSYQLASFIYEYALLNQTDG